jgi:hypothetical protein
MRPPVNPVVQNLNDTIDTILSKKEEIISPAFFDSLAQSAQNTNSEEQLLQPRKKNRDYVLPVILLLLLLYFTMLRYQYAKQLRENITVLFNMNLGQQIFRDREFSLNMFSILLYINAILVIGIYIFQLTNYFHISLPFSTTILNIAFCIAVFPAIYLLKTIVYLLVKTVYSFDTPLQYFRFNSLIIYQLLAVALLPCVILLASVEEPLLYWVVAVSLVITGIAFFTRFLKGILIAASFVKFHILYFLLYICALEIAPLLIVYKVFIKYAV